MADIYFKGADETIVTNDELNMIVLDIEVDAFGQPKLIQDKIPYSNEVVTYGRRIELPEISLSFYLNVTSFEALETVREQLEAICYEPVTIGIYDEGYEYQCNLTKIKQQTIKGYQKTFTFTFECTNFDKTPIET